MEPIKIPKMYTNRLARARNVQRTVLLDDRGNEEVHQLIDNIIYTTEFDPYSLPREIMDHLDGIDFYREKRRILREKSYSQEYRWPGMAVDPPDQHEAYHDEEGILLAINENHEPLKTEGYKLFLLSNKVYRSHLDNNKLRPQRRMALFRFCEQSGSGGAGSSSGWELDWTTYHSRLEKMMKINRLGVCMPVLEGESPYRITICGSSSFVSEMAEVERYLSGKGFEVFLPEPLVKEADYEKEHGREELLRVKPVCTQRHFLKIEKSDAILIVNHRKKGISGYFGPNTLMELSVAFYLGKSVFLLYPFQEDHPLYEEIARLRTTILNGNLDGIE